MCKCRVLIPAILAVLIAALTVASGLRHTDSRPAEQLSIIEVNSPFVKEGSAYLIAAPHDTPGHLRWRAGDLTPGHVYSMSFFYARAGVDYLNPTAEDLADHSLYLIIYEDNQIVYQNALMPAAEPQFLVIPLVIQKSAATVTLTIPPGQRIVIGHFGQSIESGNLKRANPYNDGGRNWLRSPDDVLPRVYRGLRDFEVIVRAKRPALSSSIVPEVQRILLWAEMAATTALLPRTLPGHNTFLLRAASAGPGASVTAVAEPVAGPWATLSMSVDPVAPADGVTFARAKITALDDDGQRLPGLFFRLRSPPPLTVIPFDVAVNDAPQDNLVREFHVTSRTPGRFVIPIDIWSGHDWRPTGQHLQITFEPTDQHTVGSPWSAQANAWYEPEAIHSPSVSAGPVEASWHGDGLETELTVDIVSVAMPRVEWSVTGPVRDLRVFNLAFQPDPATLWSLGQSLGERSTGAGTEADRQLALDLLSYVSLSRRANLQTNYNGLQTYFPARVLRKGRGWCGPHAKALFGVAVAAGLRARISGTLIHTVTDIASDQLEPTMFDANLEVFVCQPNGHLGSLSLLDAPGVRFLGFGVDGKTRRGDDRQVVLDSYFNRQRQTNPHWYDKARQDTPFRIMFQDDRLLAFDLKPWERLRWTGGWIDRTRVRSIDKRYQQTLLVKEATLRPGAHTDSELACTGFTAVGGSIQLASDALAGELRFPFRTPIEVDRITVALEGLTGQDSWLAITVRPALPPPILTGPPDNLPLK